MPIEGWFWLWTGIALIWWCLALRLVDQKMLTPCAENKKESFSFITLFKPLPLNTDAHQIPRIKKALESFWVQLDNNCEVLLGIWEQDREAWQSSLAQWEKDFPESWHRVKVIWRQEPDSFSNPKIAWQFILANHAKGEWWLWSDVDIIAPPNFIKLAREQFSKENCQLLTHAYVIKRIENEASLLEALFVNMEFFPGTLILARRKKKDMGFGASLLFHRDAAKDSLFWKTLGSVLADDFMLGKWLGNSELGEVLVETTAGEKNWRQALLHYLRWQKTIRWCQPLGFAMQIIIFPLIGWIIFLLLTQQWQIGLLGGLITLMMELIFAKKLCYTVNCIMPWHQSWGIVVWSLVRAIGWVLCWLPWPVKWGQTLWWNCKQTKAV
jgi:ceramide glucosyltransferase